MKSSTKLTSRSAARPVSGATAALMTAMAPSVADQIHRRETMEASLRFAAAQAGNRPCVPRVTGRCQRATSPWHAWRRGRDRLRSATFDRVRHSSVNREQTIVLDLVVRSGRVVTPWGVGAWDVAVQGATIVAVAEPDTLGRDVGRVIDATGKIVVPGGIEPHAHAGLPLPYPGARERKVSAAPPDVISKAAVCGGTTTIVDFANWRPGLELPDVITEKDAVYRNHSYADYTFHGVLVGMGTIGSTPRRGVEVRLALIESVPGVGKSGFNRVKVWTTNATTKRPRQMMDFGHVWAVMEKVAAAGGVLAVHAEDEDIVMFMYRRLHAEGRIGTEYLHEAHNTLSEDLSFRRTIRLAERTGCAIYLMHVSAKDGVDAIAAARRRGFPVYGETLHHYATFTSDVYKKPDGPLYHTYPSLKGPADG